MIMDEQLRAALGDLIAIEEIVFEWDTAYVALRTPQIKTDLMAQIEARLAPLGLKSSIASINRIPRGMEDTIVLRIEPVTAAWNPIRRYTMTQEVETPGRWAWLSNPWVNGILFVITFAVVFMTGAATIINRSLSDDWDWVMGFQFSFSLLGILTAHEFGHYFAARYHKLNVTLPYYLPGILIPPIPWLGFLGTTIMPGTFGAFIRIKSPIINKRQLMDVGAAGPIAGFVVCLFVLIYGFATIPDKIWAYQFYNVEEIFSGQPVMYFGDSLLFRWLGHGFAGDRMPAMYDIVHYPFIFAGWFGLLVTALNMLPIGQLDGGHILYALIGSKQRFVAYGAFAVIITIGLFYGAGSWFIWALLILFLIRFKHPRVMDEDEPLDNKRIAIGIVSFLIFFVSFIPLPVYEKIPIP